MLHLFNTRGGHGTCFAYGQTGSGKTVTMMGLGPADRGGNAQVALTPTLTLTLTLTLTRHAEALVDCDAALAACPGFVKAQTRRQEAAPFVEAARRAEAVLRRRGDAACTL